VAQEFVLDAIWEFSLTICALLLLAELQVVPLN
jgi:hypothetical protein